MNAGVKRLAMLFVGCVLVGCAAHYSAGSAPEPYSFWYGFWHGLIAPFVLLGLLLSWLTSLMGFSILQTLELIGFPNTGTAYEVGFVLGVLTLSSAGR